MNKWLKRRWERAKQLAADGRVHGDGAPGSYHVESENTPGLEYDVVANFDRLGQLRSCCCTCPDFANSWRLALNPRARQDGIPRLHGVVVCKHVLAAGIVESSGA